MLGLRCLGRQFATERPDTPALSSDHRVFPAGVTVQASGPRPTLARPAALNRYRYAAANTAWLSAALNLVWLIVSAAGWSRSSQRLRQRPINYSCDDA